MDVAVVVPCRDREESLARCLTSIFDAKNILETGLTGSSQAIRIVVINDNSRPGFASALRRDFPSVEFADSQGTGPAAARNTGLKLCDADLYLLTDSDCIVDRDWFVRAAKWFDSRDAPIAQGTPWLYQQKQNPQLGRAEERLFHHMFSAYVSGTRTSMLDGRCMAISRAYFDRFPRDLFATWISDASVEERIVTGPLLKAGLEIEWQPAIKTYHEDPPNVAAVWRQKYRHGAGRVYLWPGTPSCEFLAQHYFTVPVAAGSEAAYVVPAHLAFLLGYRDACSKRNSGEVTWWPSFLTTLETMIPGALSCLPAVEAEVSVAK